MRALQDDTCNRTDFLVHVLVFNLSVFTGLVFIGNLVFRHLSVFCAGSSLFLPINFANWRNNEIVMNNDVFHALSDPTRRRIVRLLRAGDLSAGDIAEHFELARSTMSGHFNVLKQAGLIVSERNGTTIVYSLNVSVVEDVLASILDLFGKGEQEV